MKKFGILFLLMAIVIIISSPQKVFADETGDLRSQAQSEYWAKRYGYSTCFYEETQYYEPLNIGLDQRCIK
jgi:hypothetical protein